MTSGKSSNNFIATPDFLPSIRLAPSEQNAIEFAFKYSFVKPKSFKVVNNVLKMHSVVDTNSFKATNNVNRCRS
jgi:hypothetical protein